MKNPPPTRALEREHERLGVVAGVDEVGYGPWAGDLVVCAFVGSLGEPPEGIRDSKKISASKRAKLVPEIVEWATDYAFGVVTPAEIDSLGVRPALQLATYRALDTLRVLPDVVLLDGSEDWIKNKVSLVVHQPKLDATETIVSAASILAKEHRDNMMRNLAHQYPEYAWEKNMGYGTSDHARGIEEYGPTIHHRLSWSYWSKYPQWEAERRAILVSRQQS